MAGLAARQTFSVRVPTFTVSGLDLRAVELATALEPTIGPVAGVVAIRGEPPVASLRYVDPDVVVSALLAGSYRSAQVLVEEGQRALARQPRDWTE